MTHRIAIWAAVSTEAQASFSTWDLISKNWNKAGVSTIYLICMISPNYPKPERVFEAVDQRCEPTHPPKAG